MTREEKKAIIESLTEKFKETPHFYITDASGFTVAQVNTFRRMCFEKGVEYRVYKNTFIKQALNNLDADFSELDSVLKGFSGIIFASETANLPAKVIKDYRKKAGSKETRPVFKGASIDSDVVIGENNLDMLASLKSKEELLGEVIGLLQSPAKNVISALQSGQDTLAGLVKTLSERES
ncbi:50S ribosomal protein L10 [Echinicola vietnamensis]|uniref:Large ribosomal subunit protein uL10 n=1 Tax=Echinicola vietnamensis (strain DSM 17526 / LMG 23754 / KMM 6221) TaxID=926556 RepID=L0FRM0_ECHVK|nr:50S ribosomal protein L10 [Echinicola vietnamensis]AGA76559.1 ribosomal protein L10 [Echinicola vietnamensis DSM 17526]